MNNYENYQNYEEEDEIDLGAMIKYVFKHAVIIIIATVICTGLGAGFAIWKNKGNAGKYASTTTIYCDPVINNTELTIDLNAQKALLNDYAVFVTSRPVLEKAIDDLGLDMTAEKLQQKVTAEVIENTRVLKITVTDAEPENAQAIATVLVDTTINQIGKISSLSTPHILEPANLPTVADESGYKSVKKFALIGAIAGFFIICVVYAIIYICSDKIMNDDDVKRFLHLMTIAEIKKGEAPENCFSKIRTEFDFDTILLGQDQSLIDEFISAAELSKTGKNIVPMIPVGSHAKIVGKSIEKLLVTGCKIPGVILTEA